MFERLACLLGGAAIIGWLLKWFSVYRRKHQDLAELDSRVRAALREAADAERHLRTTDRERFRRELRALQGHLAEAQDRIAATSVELRLTTWKAEAYAAFVPLLAARLSEHSTRYLAEAKQAALHSFSAFRHDSERDEHDQPPETSDTQTRERAIVSLSIHQVGTIAEFSGAVGFLASLANTFLTLTHDRPLAPLRDLLDEAVRTAPAADLPLPSVTTTPSAPPRAPNH